MLAGSAVSLPLMSACSTDKGANAVRIAYQQFGSGTVMTDFLTGVGRQLAKSHPDVTIELVPLVASEDDYFTKNELMMSSERTTPDLVYEDTFILKSDVGAGYLRPMDHYIDSWERWSDFYTPAKKAVTYDDGKIYAVPTHTDVRVLWYQKDVFKRAGIKLPWEPQTWDDVLSTLRKIKSSVPDVTPFNIYAGQPQGEKASMQGFEMLLYGTGSTLYDEKRKKWVVGSQGFIDSLAFVHQVFAEELTPSLADALDPNISETITNSWLPEGQLAVNLDGSWISQNWGEGAPGAWPEWADKMGMTRMPTQKGQGTGWVTLAGGWSWAIPRLSDKPDRAWTVLQQMMTTENMTDLALADSQVTIRKDIASNDKYQGYSPTIDFFTSMVDKAIYRPALAAYPKVSSVIQESMESVMTGKATPEDAAAAYDAAVIDIVGPEKTVEGRS